MVWWCLAGRGQGGVGGDFISFSCLTTFMSLSSIIFSYSVHGHPLPDSTPGGGPG